MGQLALASIVHTWQRNSIKNPIFRLTIYRKEREKKIHAQAVSSSMGTSGLRIPKSHLDFSALINEIDRRKRFRACSVRRIVPPAISCRSTKIFFSSTRLVTLNNTAQAGQIFTSLVCHNLEILTKPPYINVCYYHYIYSGDYQICFF